MPAAGDTHETLLVEDLTRTQIVQYAGASGDYNPLHSDEPFVTKVAGYPTVFAHGMLTMGMTGRALAEWLGHDALRSFGVRFTKQVWPGDTLTVRFAVDSVEDGVAQISVSVTNDSGEEVLAGTATAAA
jgi:acyl dehydratase